MHNMPHSQFLESSFLCLLVSLSLSLLYLRSPSCLTPHRPSSLSTPHLTSPPSSPDSYWATSQLHLPCSRTLSQWSEFVAPCAWHTIDPRLGSAACPISSLKALLDLQPLWLVSNSFPKHLRSLLHHFHSMKLISVLKMVRGRRHSIATSMEFLILQRTCRGTDVGCPSTAYWVASGSCRRRSNAFSSVS